MFKTNLLVALLATCHLSPAAILFTETGTNRIVTNIVPDDNRSFLLASNIVNGEEGETYVTLEINEAWTEPVTNFAIPANIAPKEISIRNASWDALYPGTITGIALIRAAELPAFVAANRIWAQTPAGTNDAEFQIWGDNLPWKGTDFKVGPPIVPEPSSAVLAMLGAGLTLRRRREC